MLDPHAWGICAFGAFACGELRFTQDDQWIHKLKLPQESQIVLVEDADIIEFETRLHHGRALNAEAEGKPTPLSGINAASAQYVRMHHSRAGEFKPAGFA